MDGSMYTLVLPQPNPTLQEAAGALKVWPGDLDPQFGVVLIETGNAYLRGSLPSFLQRRYASAGISNVTRPYSAVASTLCLCPSSA
jgi:hypothetical protein